MVIQLMVRATFALFGIEVRQALTAEASEEQLRGAIELHQGEGVQERHERAMLRSPLDLGDVWEEEIMNHRKDVGAGSGDPPTDNIHSEDEYNHIHSPPQSREAQH